jgi:hypothetical protein
MLIVSPSLASFGKKGQSPGDFGLLLGGEEFHDGDLHICTSLFEGSDEISAVLGNGYALGAAVTLVLASAHHAALNELVKQATGG